jgi:nucleoside-diphosphate-sugar epimerase
MLVRELLERGVRVRALDSLLGKDGRSLLGCWSDPLFEFVRGDIRDGEIVARALDGVDAVVHLAAIVGDPACTRQPELAREVNFEATTNLLGAAQACGVRRFVFASTCSNYGKLNGSAYATEEFELRPISLYAETKVAAELEVLDRSRPDFQTVCLRLATVYGASPRMRFDLTVNEFTRDVVLGRPLIVYGEQFWRPYVHVGDAARAIADVLEAGVSDVAGEVFNVGDTQENYRKLDLVGLLRERHSDLEVEFVPQDDDPRDYRVSFDKIRARLGFNVTTRVPGGIDEVAEIVRSGAIADPDAPIYRN